ncbi:nucleotide-diphospho-sugar transferase [Naematelia encephala]|uniref:Translation initiation factor eIF2B subunit gamma n=1 Tax=Naematelia encephala TaxID=71784 RepID=A0A1Y2AZW5_9TREE|nr:nucleotide-diphospho-sugar transferase [Naematelia encephala]
MSARMYESTPGNSKRRAVDTQDFMAVILVGYGENLFPFNEGPNVLPKALLPVGNVPIINSVLDWIFDSGLTDILIIVPPTFHSAISNHLSENYSSTSHPRARILLRRTTDGDKDEDDERSETGGRNGEHGAIDRDGTARLLRRFKNHIKGDFVLLPCDVVAPRTLTLSSVLDKHRANPQAVLTSVFYEPVEAVKDGEEKLLVALDQEAEEVLGIQPLESLEEDLDIRMNLIASHPRLSLTIRLLDAHIYVFRRTILDLMATRRSKDLDSMREQVVPWLVKGGWQKGLQKSWAPILDPRKRDPFAGALARSTSTQYPSSLAFAYPTPDSSPSSDHTPLPPTGPTTPSRDHPMSASFGAESLEEAFATSSKHQLPWKCQIIISAPSPPSIATASQGKGKGKPQAAPEADHLIRANSLAGYWELNRKFLRSLAPTVAPPPNRVVLSEDGAAPAISVSAQISPDSLLGEGTKVGDRASIKKCIVGRHCNIGRGAKLTGSVLWDFVTVEEKYVKPLSVDLMKSARIENTILCSNVRVGDKSQIKDCEFGPGYEAKPGANLKGERLVAGQEV